MRVALDLHATLLVAFGALRALVGVEPPSPVLVSVTASACPRRRPGGNEPVFYALREPSQAEIAQVAWSICERTVSLLKKMGRWLDADPSEDPLANQEPLLASLAQASLSGTLAMGPNAGKRVVRLFGAAAREANEHDSPKSGYGFDLHASVRASGHDTAQRERLCRYLLRPPLSAERLSLVGEDKYCVRLKRPWSDGTSAIVLTELELLARLAVLVPPPRVHTIRFFGVLAPRAKMRAQVVTAAPSSRGESVACCARCRT